jgi:hypothetical protein
MRRYRHLDMHQLLELRPFHLGRVAPGKFGLSAVEFVTGTAGVLPASFLHFVQQFDSEEEAIIYGLAWSARQSRRGWDQVTLRRASIGTARRGAGPPSKRSPVTDISPPPAAQTAADASSAPSR